MLAVSFELSVWCLLGNVWTGHHWYYLDWSLLGTNDWPSLYNILSGIGVTIRLMFAG